MDERIFWPYNTFILNYKEQIMLIKKKNIAFITKIQNKFHFCITNTKKNYIELLNRFWDNLKLRYSNNKKKIKKEKHFCSRSYLNSRTKTLWVFLSTLKTETN